MKNQYVADIGDYGKYSLLRAFAEAGIHVGVNWYLTKDDGSTDGKFKTYLDGEHDRFHDPEVFDRLRDIKTNGAFSVKSIEESDIVPNALYYSDEMIFTGNPSERESTRKKWFADSRQILKDADLIYLDPDNGLSINNDACMQGAEKYALPDEIEEYLEDGDSVVYYCHKGRRSLSAWNDYKSFMIRRLPKMKCAVLTFHRGTQRSFVFLIQPHDYVRYRRIIDEFIRRWRKDFTEEAVNGVMLSMEHIDSPFRVTLSSGREFVFQKQADGNIQIRDSAKPNQFSVLTPEQFCYGFSG